MLCMGFKTIEGNSIVHVSSSIGFACSSWNFVKRYDLVALSKIHVCNKVITMIWLCLMRRYVELEYSYSKKFQMLPLVPAMSVHIHITRILTPSLRWSFKHAILFSTACRTTCKHAFRFLRVLPEAMSTRHSWLWQTLDDVYARRSEGTRFGAPAQTALPSVNEFTLLWIFA